MLKYCLLVLSVIYLSGCSTINFSPSEEEIATTESVTTPPSPPPTPEPVLESPSVKPTSLEKLLVQYREWKGTRYRMGGLSKSGVDCSGFVMLTFRDQFGMTLPRSTREQHRLGQEVNKNELLPGDLVFFHTGRYDHVGIYIQEGEFLHASTRAGVKLSHLSESYWRKRFWKAKRLNLQPS